MHPFKQCKKINIIFWEFSMSYDTWRVFSIVMSCMTYVKNTSKLSVCIQHWKYEHIIYLAQYTVNLIRQKSIFIMIVFLPSTPILHLALDFQQWNTKASHLHQVGKKQRIVELLFLVYMQSLLAQRLAIAGLQAARAPHKRSDRYTTPFQPPNPWNVSVYNHSSMDSNAAGVIWDCEALKKPALSMFWVGYHECK